MDKEKQATGDSWPEQEAVWKWKEKYGFELSYEQEIDLKTSVSDYRIELQHEIAALKAEIERKDEALVAVELLIRNNLRNGYSSYELGRAKEIIDQALHIKEE